MTELRRMACKCYDGSRVFSLRPILSNHLQNWKNTPVLMFYRTWQNRVHWTVPNFDFSPFQLNFRQWSLKILAIWRHREFSSTNSKSADALTVPRPLFVYGEIHQLSSFWEIFSWIILWKSPIVKKHNLCCNFPIKLFENSQRWNTLSRRCHLYLISAHLHLSFLR